MRWILAVTLLITALGSAPAHADRALPQSDITPAAQGTAGHRRIDVFHGNQVVDIGAPYKAEFTSELTVPRTGERQPLVVFLHGAHASCYTPGEADFGWPCRGKEMPVPSYQGYRYVAQRLATQGFATLSISANGVNGQEDSFADGGTTARAHLVDVHLRALAASARGESPRYPRSIARRIDLSRVLLVGHSRGAAGVALVAIDNRFQAAPYRVRGVVSLAGILQVKLGVPQLPFVSVLPQCDGDVFMLEGQNYIEVGSRLPGDDALRSAVWLPGANHNFLNTQWTPGLSAAPSSNDAAVYDDWAGPCRKGKRISSAQERRLARSYLAATARLVLRGEQSMAQFLNGSGIRPGDVGEHPTRSTATGGGAVLLERQWRGPLRARGLEAKSGLALKSAERYGWNETQTPHWLPALKFNKTSTRQRALMVAWDGPGRVLTRLPAERDISRAWRVQARVAVDTNTWRRGRVALTVRDAAGVTASVPVPAAQLTQIGANLPGHLWAQSISVPVKRLMRAKPTLDLRRIEWIGLSPQRGSGRVWMLDVWATPRITTLTGTRPAAAVKASGYATHQNGAFRVHLRMTALAAVARDITVRYRIYGYAVDGVHARGTVTIPRGVRSVRTTLRVPGPPDDRVIVATYPDAGAVSRQDYVWLFVR